MVSGCGDRCEVLCQQTGDALATCRPDAMSWPDLGARSRADFVSQCRNDWDRARLDLSSGELSTALEVCDDTTEALGGLTCEELVAIYATD
jgi:hypothetical protein